MLYYVEIPEIAHNDIHDLSEYVFRMSLNEAIARKIYDNLYSKIFSLNFMPYRFEKYIGEYRRIVVDGNYKILYKVEENSKKVIIIRVIRSEMKDMDQ